jgi:predicted nuclease of predicted toxin-antitoxin system
MVPRAVPLMLASRGRSALEVRQVLAHDASDGLIARYAQTQSRVVVTHDPGMADRCRREGVRHVWLRTRETLDATGLDSELEVVEQAFRSGALRIEITEGRITVLGNTRRKHKAKRSSRGTK